MNACFEHQQQQPGIWLRAFFCLLLVLVAGQSESQAQTQSHQPHILLLASKDLPLYQQVIDSFKENITGSNVRLSIIMSPDKLTQAAIKNYDLIIPIGTAATRQVLRQKVTPPVLSTFIPKQTFITLTSDPLEQLRLQAGQLSAIYLEQPFQRQLKLLDQIEPEVSSVGTVLGSSSISQQPELEKAISAMHWQLNQAQLHQDDNPIEVLTPVIANSNAFIAVPDRSIFNRSTAKWILLMSFRQRIPLIAYSKRYVDAGAIAAVYSTPKTVGQEAADWVKRWLNKPSSLPVPAYPKCFDFSINKATARSLRLNIPAKEVLREALK